MQPSWRIISDGSFSKAVPTDETWSNLGKGGSAGLYIVTMALSWWVRVVQGNDDLALWAVVDDVCWVLGQLCEKGKVSRMTKRARDELDDPGSDKRYVSVHLYYMTGLAFNRPRV